MSIRARILTVLAVVVALVFVGLRLTSDWAEIDSSDLDVSAVAVGIGLVLVGQLSVGIGWNRLLPDVENRIGLAASFHLSQIGKYVPVAVGQAAGQVLLAGALGLERQRAAAAWVVQTLIIISAGLLVGAGLALTPDVPWYARISVIGAGASLVVVHRPNLERLLGALGNRIPRLSVERHIPERAGLRGCLLASATFFLLHGMAYAVHLEALTDSGSIPRWVSVYAIATALSIATPLPAGLGVREVLLVALSGTSAALALRAALLVRLTQITVELLLAAGASAVAIRQRRDLQT